MADKKKKRFGKWFYRLFFGSSLLLIIVCLIVGYKVYNYVVPFYERAQTYDLNKIDDVEVPSIIYDRNGIEIGRIYVQNRSVISLEEMPQYLIDCVIAQEDQRFWEQKGVDWIGLFRGVWLNFKAGESTQGASTMTMQLARNVFNLKEEAIERDESSHERKIVEICVATRIGNLYSSESGKKYILESYLNRVPFGHGYYGIRSAALGYFGKEPEDLELYECASLVSCIKNPSAISPIRYPETNKKARDHVFRRLLAEDVITQEEHDNLVKQPIVVNPKPLKRQTSHMYEKVSTVAQEILGEGAMSSGGYKIYSTIDTNVQNAAELALRSQLDKIESAPGYKHTKYLDYDSKKGPPAYLQGGVLVSDPQTGKVLAHVGGRNYSHTQYDFVESAKRPVGTAILPFLYAYAIEEGYTPVSKLSDTPLNNRLVMIGGREGILGEWGSETLVPEYEGEISLRRALQASKISASIRLGRDLGITNFAEFCQKFEMEFPDEDELLTRDLLGWNTLSIMESSRAYASLVNEGKLIDKFLYIDRIEDTDGTLVYLQGKSDSRNGYTQVIQPSTAYQIQDILSDGLDSGGNLAQSALSLRDNGFQGGAKTGTPYNFADAWAFAFDKNYVCASWLGFQKGNNGAIIANGFAKDLALPVIAETLNSLDLKTNSGEVIIPETIVEKEICKESGLLATRYCFAVEEESQQALSTSVIECFKYGHEPTSLCSTHMGLEAGSSFGDKFAPKEGETSARPVLEVKSVKPRTKSVIGGDPYKAVSSALEEEIKEPLPKAYTTSTLVLNDNVAGEQEAKIKLPNPKKLQLKINAEGLHPSFMSQ